MDSKDILEKYSSKIESQLDSNERSQSEEYSEFKREMIKENSPYERWAHSLGNVVSLKVSPKDRIKQEKLIKEAHLAVTPEQTITLAIVAFLVPVFLTILSTAAIFVITEKIQLSLVVLGIMASVFIAYYAYTMPKRIASEWKLKASSQMVPAVLYMVVYMKHTSNLEKAIEFAAKHLEGPLALDFKKIFYDVEIGKYSTIKQSLDHYLENWREYAPEFIESIHLIESSLYEPSEQRRVEILEKSLQVILDGVYEKMLKYSRDIRSPLTNVYMLGIILPTLGLALLPLATTLLKGTFQWYHIMIIFNIIIPFLVFYLTTEILLKRPGGYGESSILELNPNYSEFKSNKHWVYAFWICLPLLIIGLLPFIMQLSFFSVHDFTLGEIGIPFISDTKLFDFKNFGDKTVGPFSPIAVIISMCVPVCVALFFSIAYGRKTKNLIKSREQTRLLEVEFTNSLFQLGNRLGDNIPAEIAFAKVAESTQGQTTHSFFSLVNQNIQQLGMSLEKAIFDKKRGALTFYPSTLISTSMHILVESVKKGLQVAARSLMSISEYVKNIEKINQRLRDLLAEVVSDMKSNMVFLAPLLSGIIIGLSTMITVILTRLQDIKEAAIGGGGDTGASFAGIGDFLSIFDVTQMIPPYFTQLCIGVYIIEITFILTHALGTVDSGQDILKEKYELGKNLKRGILLYIITGIISVIALTALSLIALSNI